MHISPYNYVKIAVFVVISKSTTHASIRKVCIPYPGENCYIRKCFITIIAE